ncbi:MAG: aldehyde dehydrogenase [Lachnospiraceae bacterium]|jgi:aldehyde dehydrogenase (NAD+)|nr:aldehyde dehydrogenase [Lachnospiraceae bacterium]
MDIHTLVARQREYFLKGASRNLAFRQLALQKLQAAIKAQESLLIHALTEDLGKTPMETYMTETGLVLDEIRFHLKHLSRWMKEKTVATPLAQFYSHSFTSPEPYGVALIMTPWNYPLQLCLEPLVGAISAGNCAVVKPSAYAPATSAAIRQLIEGIFPPEYIAVVEGGRAENSTLLQERFDYIFFTGSVSVGKTVMAAAAKHLTPVTLELGGKSPVILDETANLKIAARRIAFGKILNAGQTCVAPDYLFLPKRLLEPFLREYQKALHGFFPDGSLRDMPFLVNEKHFNRVTGLMKPEKAAIGGGYNPDTRQIEPTVLVDVTPDAPIMQEEIFGPVLPILTYEKLEECISYIQSHEKPLALYLFTESRRTQQQILSSCSFGGGCINDTVIHLATPHMGFGGVGASGMGSYHGYESFRTFSHFRSVVKKSTRLDLPMRYHPYTPWKDRIIRMFLR